MNKILLNCLIPNDPRRPGYSLSVIKSYLEQNGYEVGLKYWNLILRDFISSFWYDASEKVPLSNIEKDLMPFLTLYAFQNEDNCAINCIAKLFNDCFEVEDVIQHLKIQCKILENKIIEELQKPEYGGYDYYYVQSKFYKYTFISTGVFGRLLKAVYPSTTLIIEAQEFPTKALALVDSFECYDYATWGEYEQPLLQLLDVLTSKREMPKSQIPNVVYRDENGNTRVSQYTISNVLNLNETPYADFSDYITQSDIPREEVLFPLEGGRGCQWNKCIFCYMNDGYIYRRKTPSRMLEEIEHYIKEYGAQKFYFIDNDIIGDSTDDFRVFLRGLKELKKRYDIKIDFGEVIAQNVNADIVQEMSEAGFQEIQIGYEAISDNALRKINKKSRFAHIILASRWCKYYGVSMSEQNILRSLPFENEQIILENICNLFYLRFLLAEPWYRHSMRELCIVSTSPLFRYYSDNGRLDEFDKTFIDPYIPKGIIKPQYAFDVMIKKHIKQNPLWGLFVKTERYYKENLFSYTFSHDDGRTIYKEYFNGECFKVLTLSDMQSAIIGKCSRKVVSLDELISALTVEHYDSNQIFKNVEFLNQHGLVYYSKIEKHLVSVVDISDNNKK